jgi:hypothetical protein
VTARSGGHERVYRWLLRLHPAEFRARFSDEMVQLFGDLLGLAGILGGAVLLAAFVIDIPWELNIWRIILFNAGAMAIVAGVHLRQAWASPRLALAAAAAAVLANAWYLVMVLLSIGRPQPPEADIDFRLVWFFAGLAMWLADAAFGLVTARLGMVTRWGALALAVGSVLAITGMDRFELTSAANPTIFGPLSQAGGILNGLGWILLGLDLATRRRASETQPQGDRLSG